MRHDPPLPGLACVGWYGDLPKLIRPRRSSFAAVVPACVPMPDVCGDFPCDPAWTAAATRLT